MSDPDQISHEELVELQKKFSEIKHAINNALAVMMALEMSQRRPDYSENSRAGADKSAADRSSLQEFTQALNDAGPRPESFPAGHLF
jgi:hypothetical protein